MSDFDAANTRIVTNLAHVDHGKTTLVDYLLAANNIISTRLAGKLRYMDSREDEQERGITMQSSAVALNFKVMERKPDGGSSPRSYIVNMIDTPGHVDFASEVSTASRLCDGALVLVDVVEGVCTQTIAVLRQAWEDRLRPILVINKFDRLITELKLAPIEAYHHLAQLIEQVNAVMGGFFASERMEDDLRWREERERRLAQKKEAQAEEADAIVNEEVEFQEKDDEDIYFAPERGNVVFASALDGWGFRVSKFAQLFAVKLGMKEANLRRVLWGDFYLDPKTKRAISHRHLRGRALKPLFVQLVLENIWAVYDSVALNPNPDKVIKIVATLGLKIPPRDLKSKDSRHLLSMIFSQWLSLSTCIIQAIIDVVPAPSVAQRTRIPKMLHPDLREPTVQPKNKLEKDLFSCDSSPDASLVAYVSKMFAVPKKHFPENKRKALTAEEMREKAREARLARQAAPETASDSVTVEPSENGGGSNTPDSMEDILEEDEALLGFSRLYSGRIRVGTHIYALLPKYNDKVDPTDPVNVKHIVFTVVEGLYTMMGRELVAVDEVRAGSIFAIKGLEGKVWRNATLCAPSSVGVDLEKGFEQLKGCSVNLGRVHSTVAPIVRVALEPERPADMPKLVRGLKLLSQADPCVETFQQHTGEHVILTAGELHLERCLKDLRERFARIEIQASKPIVPFRETAVKGVEMAPPKTPDAPRGTIHGASVRNLVTFTVRAVPLAQPIIEFLLDNSTVLKAIQEGRTDQGRQFEQAETDNTLEAEGGLQAHTDASRSATVRAENFWTAFEEKCKEVGGEWAEVASRVWAFGPQRTGSCLLVDSTSSTVSTSLMRRLAKLRSTGNEHIEEDKLALDFHSYLETGFELATFQGPLCAEPVMGMAYFIQALQVDRTGIEEERQQNRIAQVTGSFISAVKDACRNGFLDWSPRLMLAMYTCDIQASTDVLGKVYGVVAKRRGRIIAEEMKEGTAFFTVRAMLPVVESFGFADDIRKRTSGAASPQLIFSGYELLDEDPFWVPTTEEELEDLGEKADRSNVAKAYMDSVRERKGMFVDRKIVEFAEKQRTLKR
ncbi:P-loop containing nucleoside triphosphate hydrolase protein [Punctularia strigosozonata HHB-11173 SS5]|uniref:P-loop containing nucleoside triphosphate hydrolase protein n=1 Tax=Punctularia strigosozonata (strain HHB-11173) TaxID=741275 RepID=UPI0004417217|nr:P-loop containing nucleoside triphosphate hydrolase protein [Punctularia strigosozonata HHB-11173 SS5]EIN12824.1 P-loop containing nucleoside triphosphate hydrolase protein [Punctularia strigosozonata HHB-11173 SS5]